MTRWTYRLTGTVLALLMAASPEAFASQPAQESSAATPVVQPSDLPDTPSTTQQKLASEAQARIELAQQTAPAVPNASTPAESNPPQTETSSQPSPSNAGNGAPPATAPSATTTDSSSTTQASTQTGTQQPVGAAAAQLGRTTGGGAAKPAGAALAPAKQKQSRSLLLKLGLIGGAAIALGTVVGLSQASPSRPPGAH